MRMLIKRILANPVNNFAIKSVFKVGAAVLLLLLLAVDSRGAALHLTESIETKCKDLVVNSTNWSMTSR